MIELWHGARLFDGTRMLDHHAILHDGSTVLATLPWADRPSGIATRDLGGGTLSPGLVDIQNNGGGGVLFNANPTVEAIRAIGAAHRAFGTTAFLPTVVTDAPAVLEQALAAAAEAVDVVPGCLGIHVEGPFIDPRRAGAHPPAMIRPMTDTDVDLLLAHKRGAMLVTLAPASADNRLIARLAAAGVVVSLGHAEATAAEADAGFAAGARCATHLFNAMSQMGHRSPGLVGVALSRPDVVCGLIADGLHVDEAVLRVAIAAKGPAGIALVSDAMPPAAGGPDRFMLGDRLATRRDGGLRLDDGTLAGADITLLDAVRFVVRRLGLPLQAALVMAVRTPACLMGVDARHGGLVGLGVADLIHLDDDLRLRDLG